MASRNEFDHEKRLLQAIGVKPTKGSGNTWMQPQDGEGDYSIVQCKSTRNKSISIKADDVLLLWHDAKVAHKVPIFYLDINGVRLLCVRPEHAKLLSKIYEEKEE